MNDDEHEPYLERLIEDAIGPLAGLLSGEELALMRQVLRDDVAGDADLARLHRAARPRVPPLRTQEEPTAGGPTAGDAPAAVVPLRRKGGAA